MRWRQVYFPRRIGWIGQDEAGYSGAITLGGRAGSVVVVPMLQSAKLALYQAMREEGLNNVTLARKMHLLEGEVRRMIDLDHQTRVGTLEKALWQLGKQMASEVRRAT